MQITVGGPHGIAHSKRSSLEEPKGCTNGKARDDYTLDRCGKASLYSQNNVDW